MQIKEFITKLQNLSEQKKKIVLWTIVVVLGVIMGFFWVRSAMNKFSEMGQAVGQIEFPSLEMPDINPLEFDSILNTTTPSNLDVQK